MQPLALATRLRLLLRICKGVLNVLGRVLATTWSPLYSVVNWPVFISYHLVKCVAVEGLTVLF